jgi:AmiR/NasT family two-component response regulator
MTVQSDERLKQAALRAGIQGYLVKPFDLKQLEEAIGISDFACLPDRQGTRIAELKNERR